MKRKFFLLGTLALIVAGGIFWSCQKEELLKNSEEELLLKDAEAEVGENQLSLVFPEDPVLVNDPFEIIVSASCGKVKIEKGYILNDDDEKIFADLKCDTEGLLWEEDGAFYDCNGNIYNESLNIAGTYIYRAKWNSNAENNSDCENCPKEKDGGFNGNKSECFVITVMNDCQTAFTGKTECDNFTIDEVTYNRKAVYTFSTVDAGNYKIQGGLTNFTGEDYLLQITSGEIDSRIPGGSSNRIVTATGSLDDCEEVVVTVLWNSTNTDEYITGDWSVEFNGEELLVIDELRCNEEAAGYEPVEVD